MEKFTIIGAALSLICSAAQAQPSAKPQGASLAALKSAAAKSLKDPSSARWEGLQRAVRPNFKGEPTEVICGYINARNSYGAYTGLRPFVFFVADQDLNIAGDRLGLANEMLKTFCPGL